MKLGKISAAVAALSLTTAPVLAQSNSAQTADRTSAATAEGEKLEGENGILIALLAAAAVIAGIIIIADDDDPTSP